MDPEKGKGKIDRVEAAPGDSGVDEKGFLREPGVRMLQENGISPDTVSLEVLELLGRQKRREELLEIKLEEAIKERGRAIGAVENLEKTVAELKIDPLTRLPLRRGLQENYSLLRKRLESLGGAAVIALVDIDKFKVFNDENGHVAGDEVLSRVAQKMKETVLDAVSQVASQNIRNSEEREGTADVVARYGGEEFAIVMDFSGIPDMNYSDVAKRRMEDIRKAIESMTIEYEGITFKVTISLGWTLVDGKERVSHKDGEMEDATLVDYLIQADRALYEAKQAGRNQCRKASSKMIDSTFDRELEKTVV